MDTTINAKAYILDRLSDEYEAMNAVLDSLVVEQMIEPNVIGIWSIKDLIAHLVYWNGLPVREVDAALRGETPSAVMDTTDDDETHKQAVDQINAQAVEASLNQSVGEVLADFAHTITELPESAFDSGSEIERLLGDTVEHTFDNNTYDHWAEHRAQIEAWIATGETQ
jgi:hypothetical protein